MRAALVGAVTVGIRVIVDQPVGAGMPRPPGLASAPPRLPSGGDSFPESHLERNTTWEERQATGFMPCGSATPVAN